MTRVPRVALILALVACSPADPLAPTGAVPHPTAALYDATAPTPTLTSAVRVDATTVRLTFTDTATDETLVSVYFSGCADFAETETIAPATTIGVERSVDVPMYADYCTVRLRYLWNPTPTIQDSWTRGPFSAPVAITEAPLATTITNGKGRKK